MKPDRMKYFPVFSLFFTLVLAISCGGGKAEKTAEPAGTAIPADTVRLIRISSPEEKAFQKINSEIAITISPVMRNRVPDSVVIAFSGKRINVLTAEPWKYSVPASLVASTGKKPLKATAWKD